MGTLVSKVGNNNNNALNGSNSSTNVSSGIGNSGSSIIVAGYDVRNYIQAQKTTLPSSTIKRRGSTPDAAEWDAKMIKKIILEKKLAAFFPAFEDITMKNDLEECPICFLYYPGGLNRAKCCKKGLCSECFIQVKKGPNHDITCPFCNQSHYVVYYSGPLTKEEKEKEVLEEQKVIELKMKMQKEEEERSHKKEENKESESINIENKLLKPEEVFQQSFEERLKKLASTPTSDDPGVINGIKIPVPRTAYPKKPRPGQTWAQLEEELLAEAISLSLLEQQQTTEKQGPEAQNASERSATSIVLRHDDETSNEFSPLSHDNSISTTGSYISLADRKNSITSIVDSPQNDIALTRRKKSLVVKEDEEKEKESESESSITSGEEEWESEVVFKNKQQRYKNEKKSRLVIQDEDEKQLALAIQLSLNSSK